MAPQPPSGLNLLNHLNLTKMNQRTVVQGISYLVLFSLGRV
jgi:hypothetical protein